MKTVLQKQIAASGLCSRRKAGELILGGRVTVNGRIAEPGMQVTAEDIIKVDGKTIKPSAEHVYIAMNKPAGYTCTNRKFGGEKNIFGLLGSTPAKGKRLFVAGRLDKESRGLIILTDDGDFAYRATHPKFGHEKEYDVRIKNHELSIKNESEIIRRLKSGIDIGEGDGMVKAKSIEHLGGDRFKIILTSGKKRQIRRMFRALGHQVEDILRVRIGSQKLGGLKEGGWKVFIP